MLFMTSGPFPSSIFKCQLLALESRMLPNRFQQSIGSAFVGPREVQGGGGRVQEGSKRGSNPLDFFAILQFEISGLMN
jgi:hypothetical protein